MCYLGVLPRKTSLANDLLQNAYDHNSDGWGVMYAHNGRVVAHKQKTGMDQFFAYWDTLPANKNIAVHFRFGTSGPQNAAACHPFEVLNKDKGDPIDLFLMHNGVLRGSFGGTNKKSDTMQYVEALARQLRLAPDLLKDRAWREAQEALLGNPNKVVMLEGNGRWHYLNYQQGKRDKKTGVWHSNEYSLDPVYSGHGMGKRANTYWDDHWDTGCTVQRYDSGKLITSETARMDEAYKNTVRRDFKRPWGLQIVREKGKAEQQVYWKPVLMGWQRMAKNASTGAFYRWYPGEGERVGCDLTVVLPASNIVRFYPKNEQAFERGDAHTWDMEQGEHVAIPVSGNASSAQTSVTLYSPSEARAAVRGGLLDAVDVPALLCPETNEPCAAGCGSHCTGGAAENAAPCFCLGQIAHTGGEDPRCKHFPFPPDAKSAAKSSAVSETNAQRLEREEEEREEAYISQMFSDHNLRQMGEDEMYEAVCDHPEAAAIALGAAHNCRWAFETESEVA
jgi:hypothetical protein